MSPLRQQLIRLLTSLQNPISTVSLCQVNYYLFCQTALKSMQIMQVMEPGGQYTHLIMVFIRSQHHIMDCMMLLSKMQQSL